MASNLLAMASSLQKIWEMSGSRCHGGSSMVCPSVMPVASYSCADDAVRLRSAPSEDFLLMCQDNSGVQALVTFIQHEKAAQERERMRECKRELNDWRQDTDQNFHCSGFQGEWSLHFILFLAPRMICRLVVQAMYSRRDCFSAKFSSPIPAFFVPGSTHLHVKLIVIGLSGPCRVPY